MAPVQVVILPVSEKHADYGKEVAAYLKENGIRVEMPETNETLGKRIREAEIQKTPYILVVGEKEENAKSVTVRSREHSVEKRIEGEVEMKKFLAKVQFDISHKTRWETT